MFDFPLLIQVCLILSVSQLRLFFCIRRVVALERNHLTGFDFYYLSHYLVKKITVMGNNKNSSRIIQKIGFQPGNTFHVQMVGRLVKKKDIRPGDQKLAKSYPCFLASGKSFNRLFKVFFPKSQTLQYAGKLAFVCVAVFQLKFMGKSGIGVHKLLQLFALYMLHFQFNGAHTFFHIKDVLFGCKKLFVNGALSVNILILSQISHTFIFCQYHVSGISRKLFHNNAQQSGFSCAVITDQSDFFPLFYVKRGIF